jgi:hypothetical protein
MTLHHHYTQQHSYNFIAPETFIGVEDTKNKGFCTNGREIDISKHVLCGMELSLRKNITNIENVEDVYADRKKTKR